MPLGMAGGMAVAGGLGALGSLGAGWMQSNAADKAANLQSQAAAQSLALQQKMFDQTRTDLAPWRTTGQNALYSLAGMYGLPTPGNPGGGASGTNAAFDAFTKLPSYTFPFQQGQLALERSLNARGLNMSGAATKEAIQFGQGQASTGLNNWLAGLSGISGQGQSAAGLTANPAYAANMGNTIGAQGQAQASGLIGSANAMAGGLSNAAGGIGNSLALYSMLAKQPGGMTGDNSSPLSATYAPRGGMGYQPQQQAFNYNPNQSGGFY